MMFGKTIGILVIFALSIATFAKAGGSHSNGGGGLHPSSKGWRSPFGLNLKSGIGRPGYGETLRAFTENHPGVKLGACPSHGTWIFPEFPESLEKDFTFFIGTEKHPLDLDSLCRNKATVVAYGQLAMALHQIAESDESGRHLIDLAVERSGGPVAIVIRSMGRKIGGIAEYAWFDPSSQLVYWSPRSRCSGLIDCVSTRDGTWLIRHEIAHLLEKAVLGARYPEASEWHDWKHPASIGDAGWLGNRTSAEAAFIEGLADALERRGHMIGNHPFVAFWSDFTRMDSDGCYSGPESVLRLRSGRLEPMIENEVYVSTALNRFLDHENENGAEDFNPRRSIQLMDAFVQAGSMSYLDLARAFDETSGTSLGSRWYREYFFADLVTGANTRSLLALKKNRYETRICLVRPEDVSLFYSPVLEAEKQEMRTQKHIRAVSAVTSLEFHSDLERYLGRYESRRDHLLEARSSFPNRESFIAAHSDVARGCGVTRHPDHDSYAYSEDERWLERMNRLFVKRFGGPIGFSATDELIALNCRKLGFARGLDAVSVLARSARDLAPRFADGLSWQDKDSLISERNHLLDEIGSILAKADLDFQIAAALGYAD